MVELGSEPRQCPLGCPSVPYPVSPHMTCYPLCRCDWLTTSLTVLLSPHFMDKPTEVWNFISRNEALEVGPRKISFVRPLPHSFIHNSPTHQPPFTSPWNGKSSLSPNPRVSGPCSGRKEQIPEWEHEQACSCVTNCFDIMERSLSYYGVFFGGKAFRTMLADSWALK